VLEQQLNSDLPGFIRALVRENVYDTVSGKYILIPAGSTLVGIYNSHVAYGQKALQAVWRRVISPTAAPFLLADLKGTMGKVPQGSETRLTATGGGSFQGRCLRPYLLRESRLAKGKIRLFSHNPATGNK
jgi:hypothetical protein